MSTLATLCPTFTLTGDDPLAGPMVAMWAAFKQGDFAGAIQEFAAASEAATAHPMGEDELLDEVEHAVSVADAMDRWGERQAPLSF